jgi:hypothetical protein
MELGFGADVSVRLAKTEHDVQKTLVLSQEAHEEGRWRDYPFSVEKRNTFIRNSIENPGYWGLHIAELKEEPVGFLYCSASEYMVGTDLLMTTVYAYYVRKKWRHSLVGGKAGIKLMRACIGWSKHRKTREVLVYATSRIDVARTDRFLRRTGFTAIGRNYTLDLSDL